VLLAAAADEEEDPMPRLRARPLSRLPCLTGVGDAIDADASVSVDSVVAVDASSGAMAAPLPPPLFCLDSRLDSRA